MNNDEIGKGWSFPPRFNRFTGGVEMVSGETEIKESLKILFSTKLGERLFRDDFGCNLDDYRFEPANANTILMIKDHISGVIETYEPRINLDGIDVDVSNIMEGVLVISLKYTIKADNTKSNLVYPYYI